VFEVESNPDAMELSGWHEEDDGAPRSPGLYSSPTVSSCCSSRPAFQLFDVESARIMGPSPAVLAHRSCIPPGLPLPLRLPSHSESVGSDMTEAAFGTPLVDTTLTLPIGKVPVHQTKSVKSTAATAPKLAQPAHKEQLAAHPQLKAQPAWGIGQVAAEEVDAKAWHSQEVLGQSGAQKQPQGAIAKAVADAGQASTFFRPVPAVPPAGTAVGSQVAATASAVAAPDQRLPEAWELDRLEQQKRLEAFCRKSAASGHKFKESVEEGWQEMMRLEASPLDKLLSKERQRLERHCAEERQRRDVAARRAHLGVLDGAALEARAEAARAALGGERASACEKRCAALKRRQKAAEEAGKQRWVAAAVMSVEASKHIMAAANAAATNPIPAA